MHEREPAGRLPVRKKLCAALFDELVTPAQLLAARLDRSRVLFQRGGHGDDRKLVAGDTGGFERALLPLVETIELSFDQLSNRLGHADFHAIDRHRQSPAAVLRLDEALGDQVLDRVHHEERIALRPLVDDRDEILWKRVHGKSRRDVLSHRVPRQILERQLLTFPSGKELLLHRLERMPAGDQLGRPVGADHHQMRGPPTAGDVRDQVQRREVAPVQVLQHEHERRVRRQRVERLAHLPEHPLARRAERLAAEELAIGRRDDRWHLHQPHRRVRAQHVNDLRILEAQLPNRVQDGQVRLAHPVLLQTLPAGRSARVRSDATLRTKVSTSVVLPMPASPVTNTTWQSPPRALFSHACICASACSRPTKPTAALCGGGDECPHPD